MDERKVSPGLVLLAVPMLVFLLAPVLVTIPISFSADPYLSFPPSGWSLRWYRAAFTGGAVLDAFGTSVVLALIVTALSILIALPAAIALVRLRWGFVDALEGFLTAPLLLPAIVLGLAILIVFAPLGLLATFPGLVAAHLVVTLPYALRVLSTALSGTSLAAEEAAATLGASPLRVFWRVTLPAIRPGLAASAALCFLVSFDEVVISLFLTGPRLTTLPVWMFHHVENEADPLVAAVSVLLIALTLVIVLVVDRTAGLSRTFVK